MTVSLLGKDRDVVGEVTAANVLEAVIDMEGEELAPTLLTALVPAGVYVSDDDVDGVCWVGGVMLVVTEGDPVPTKGRPQ
jgi:hypothetical protein